jgi:AcrR family transcriptional regulator
MPEQTSVASIREQILDAATACFIELGYDRTSIDDIAARSGLSRAQINRHFASETEIRAALVEVWSELLSAWMGSA